MPRPMVTSSVCLQLRRPRESTLMALTRIRLLGTTVLGGGQTGGSGGINFSHPLSGLPLIPPTNPHHVAEDEAVRGRWVLVFVNPLKLIASASYFFLTVLRVFYVGKSLKWDKKSDYFHDYLLLYVYNCTLFKLNMKYDFQIIMLFQFNRRVCCTECAKRHSLYVNVWSYLVDINIS